ncbi:MAG TPA: efflux RND transporter periplasmic adaptor subunit [Methylomirabilota bacterium]|nr:efflux RND transporter periplasmic adaptor subunit [Methylomirabilota bacterium]
MKKWIVLLALLAAGVWAYTQLPKWTAAKADPSAGRQTTALAQSRNIRFTVNAAGEISPAEQVSVRPEINGKIEVLTVDIGDRVKKGDLLFKLDDKELQNQRASMLTEVDRAKLELQQRKRDYDRAQQLFQEKLIALEVFENAKTSYDLAQNGLERAQRELDVLQERLTKTQISAPFNCTILTRPVSIGQAVSGSGGFNSGTEVLTIADLTDLIINAHINQADITRLHTGQQVEVSVEAVSGLVVTGKVERIAPQATIKNNIKGFAVRILLRNVEERIRPGMTANVRIPVASADDVLAVPLAAVFTDRSPDGQVDRYVYVKNGESLERRPVKVGVTDLFYAEIQDGLKNGEVVALEPPKRDSNTQSMAGMGGQQNGNRDGAGQGGKAPASAAQQPAAQPAKAAPAAAGNRNT